MREYERAWKLMDEIAVLKQQLKEVGRPLRKRRQCGPDYQIEQIDVQLSRLRHPGTPSRHTLKIGLLQRKKLLLQRILKT